MEEYEYDQTEIMFDDDMDDAEVAEFRAIEEEKANAWNEQEAVEEQAERIEGLPERFIAVFLDDDGDVQIGSYNMDADLRGWSIMCRNAAEKLTLQHHLLSRRTGL